MNGTGSTSIGRSDDIVTVGKPFPKIEKVSALDGFHVLVKWKGGRPAAVDLGPTIQTFKIYGPLRNDRALFESVHVVNSSVIAWGEDDAIDMHVSEIERLAGEAMTSADFKALLEELGLTWDGAAAQLGISRRMVGYYAASSEIPRYIALACAHLKHLRMPQNHTAMVSSEIPPLAIVEVSEASVERGTMHEPATAKVSPMPE